MSAKESGLVETAVFDICDTLYYSNTTHDFIRFVARSEPASFQKIAYEVLNSKLLPFRYFLILLNIKTGRDVLKSFNVSTLKGKSKKQLDELARRFVIEFLNLKRIEQTQKLVRENATAGIRVVLCSSSIEPVVAAVAEELGIPNYVGTTLEYSDEIFTGRINEDITRSKMQALKNRDLLGQLAFAASDNTSDLELLSQAKRALVVVHRNKKEEFWRSHNFDIINLG